MLCAMFHDSSLSFQHSDIHSQTKALDGRTLYNILYGVKPVRADSHGFGVPCAIVRLIEKLEKPKNAACGLWIG